MFDIGFSEMLLLAAIALIAIGPKQLPEVARTVGRMLNELKRATGDLTKTVLDARESTNQVISSFTSEFQETANSINKTVIETTKIEQFEYKELPPHPPMLDEHAPQEEQLSLLDQPSTKPEEKPEKKDS